MHTGHSRQSEWDAEIKLSGHGYKSHTDINKPPPLPVHAVACISSPLTCNCKVGILCTSTWVTSSSPPKALTADPPVQNLWPHLWWPLAVFMSIVCTSSPKFCVSVVHVNLWHRTTQSKFDNTEPYWKREFGWHREGKLPSRVVFAKFVGLPNGRGKREKVYRAIFF